MAWGAAHSTKWGTTPVWSPEFPIIKSEHTGICFCGGAGMFVISVQPHWKPTQPTTCTTAICYLIPGRNDRGGGWSRGYACLHLVHDVTSSRPQSLSLSLSHKGARIPTVRGQLCLAWRLIWIVVSWLQRVSMMLRRYTLACPQTSLSHGHIFKCWKYPILFFPCWPGICHQHPQIRKRSSWPCRSSFLGSLPPWPSQTGVMS